MDLDNFWAVEIIFLKRFARLLFPDNWGSSADFHADQTAYPIPMVFLSRENSSQHFPITSSREHSSYNEHATAFERILKSSPWKIASVCYEIQLRVLHTNPLKTWLFFQFFQGISHMLHSPIFPKVTPTTHHVKLPEISSFNVFFRCWRDWMMRTLVLRSCQSCATWGQSLDPDGRKSSNRPVKNHVCQGRSTPMTFPYNRGWENQPNSVGVYRAPL